MTYFVLIHLVLAVLSWALASAKGRFGFGYFLLSLFLPLIGFIFAAAMPSRLAAATQNAPVRVDPTKCPACGVLIQAVDRNCRVCGKELL